MRHRQHWRPSSSENVEAGVKWDINPNLAFTGAVYRLIRDNSRFNDPVTGLPSLSGRTRAQGIELSLAGRIMPDWQVSLGYALQEGEVRSSVYIRPRRAQAGPIAAPSGIGLDAL